MLYLDTCTVDAGYSPVKNGTVTFTVNPQFNNIADIGASGSGYISNGTGSIVSTGGWAYYISEGQWHFKIPIEYVYSISSDFGISNFDFDKYYLFETRLNTFSANIGSVSNAILYTPEGTMVGSSGGSWGTYLNGTGREFHNMGIDASSDNTCLKGYIEFDYSYESSVRTDTGTTTSSAPSADSFGVTISYSLNAVMYELSAKQAEQYKEQVSDSGTQQAVEEGNEVAEDTNSKITDFFGNFFNNLLHIFVPEDGYFSTWFDKVNTLLSEKLGMLYAPFDLVISTLQAIYSSSTTESGIPFPGIKWEDTWLVEPFTFTFSSLGSDFDDLRDKVYFATDTVLVLTFLMLLQSKVKLILEGHE